jgi:hypothetical protein
MFHTVCSMKYSRHRIDEMDGLFNLPRGNSGFSCNERGAKEKCEGNGGEHDNKHDTNKPDGDQNPEGAGKDVSL